MAKRLTKKAAYEMVKADYTMFYRPMPEEMKKLFPVITVKVLENMGFHFTVNHTGKMDGMTSLSTTCKCNEHCIKRIAKAYADLDIDTSNMQEARAAIKKYIKENPLAENICICALCFSDSQQDMQETMQQPLKRNYEIMNNGIIHDDWIPVLNVLYLRGESFGDFNSKNAAINIFKIVSKNEKTDCTTWSKNPVYFYEAEQAGYKKPRNFKLNYSSPYINKVAKIPEQYEHLIDGVFTVFTEEYAALHNIVINCGARACLSCLRCYVGFDGKIKYINELLK